MAVDWPKVQRKLGVTPDGVDGPATYAAVFLRFGARSHRQFGQAFARHASDIRANPLRLSHWFGQMGHESGGFKRLVESLIYTSPARIRAVWPSRFPTIESAKPFVRNPAALAEKVYGGRMGNDKPGDGARYIGRGLVHLTGKANYETYGRAIGVDLIAHPEKAAEPETAVALAVAYWQRNRLNTVADRNDIRELTRRINGGWNGLQDRITRTELARDLFE